MPALDDVLGDRRWLVLTGAGVSTDSGIPDYRGPDAPVRTPMTYQEFVATPAAHQRYWARAHAGWGRMSGVQPNTSHLLLAAMQREGRLSGLITQNVDGLHSRAGHRDVIDLHGRLDQVICIDCRATSRRDEVRARLLDLNPDFDATNILNAPDGDADLNDTSDFRVAPCEACGGRLKPDVVFFGENVPRDRVAACSALVAAAESLVVLGSSLQVMSGLRFVRAAAKRGIPIVIINRGTTRGDELATLRIGAGCAETLSEIHRAATVDSSANSTLASPSV